MKRSEALRLIQNKIEELDGISSMARGPVIEPCYALSDAILTNLEEAGMLPPRAEFNYAAGFGTFKDYAWEKE